MQRGQARAIHQMNTVHRQPISMAQLKPTTQQHITPIPTSLPHKVPSASLLPPFIPPPLNVPTPLVPINTPPAQARQAAVTTAASIGVSPGSQGSVPKLSQPPAIPKFEKNTHLPFGKCVAVNLPNMESIVPDPLPQQLPKAESK